MLSVTGYTALVLATLTLSACTPSPAEDGTASTVKDLGSTKADLCQASPLTRDADLCQTVTIDGTPYRYGFMPAVEESAVTADETVILDVGGPGVSPLSLIGLPALKRSYGGSNLDGYNILVLEEPWVTDATAPECESALRDYYRAAREGYGSQSLPDTTPLARCIDENSEAGFIPEVYRQVVQAAEEATNSRVTGFIGSSFGATRLTYLDFTSSDFSILVNPFPANSDGDAWLSARAETTRRNFSSAAPLAAQDGPSVTDRSLPLTAFDVASATVQASYTGPPSETPTLDRIANDSDALWGRYFEHDISAGWLAYWEEACPALRWTSPSERHAAADDVSQILAIMHEPCRSLQRDPMDPVDKPAAASCIAASTRDAVTPIGLVRASWTSRAFIETDALGHRGMEGLDACWTEVKAQQQPG
jgi:hypothetical protein